MLEIVIAVTLLGVSHLAYNGVTNYLDSRRFRRGFAADDRDAAEKEAPR